MKIIVNSKNYTSYDYDAYYDGGTPENNPYVVGQVVVIPDESHDDPKNNFVLAVVLGILTKDELRTDMHGMVALENVRPAVVTDFGKSNITYIDALYKECQGYKVSRDFDKFEWIIEEPNYMRNLRKEIETQLLGDIYPAIGIDKPSNHDDIVEFIVNDVEVTADPVEWHSGDISIGFRRFIESISE